MGGSRRGRRFVPPGGLAVAGGPPMEGAGKREFCWIASSGDGWMVREEDGGAKIIALCEFA